MRVWLILGAMLIAGCGSFVTMEELQEQALLTGDWSAVEQREKVLARRAERRGPSCRNGQVAYCEIRMGDKVCRCLDRDTLADVFASFY